MSFKVVLVMFLRNLYRETKSRDIAKLSRFFVINTLKDLLFILKKIVFMIETIETRLWLASGESKPDGIWCRSCNSFRSFNRST